MITKIRFILLLCVLIFSSSMQEVIAQQNQGKKSKKINVKSQIVDQEGIGIANALVTVGEGLTEVRTNENGIFSVRTNQNTTLLVEALGYESQLIDLSDGLPGEEITLIQALIFAGERDQIRLPLDITSDKRSLTGAVSKIEGNELESYPDLTISNALQGRLMGLIARQTVNGLGNNPSNLYVRGLSRGGADGGLILVDGLERPMDYLLAEEIQSIEVLKDATSKILYGPRAANGVIMITTKRGRPNSRVFRSTIDYGVSMSTRMPDFLNSYEYASLYNEARENDGLPPYYTDADLEGYRNSEGPNDQRYPDADYQDYFLRNSAPYRKATLEYSGGDEATQYALVLGYAGGDGLEKLGNQPSLDRFNVRGNLDMDINDFISASLGASGVMETREWSGINNSQAFSAISSHRPNEYPFILDDPALQSGNGEGTGDEVPPLGGSLLRPDNLYGSIFYGGFSEFRTFYGETNLGLNFDLNHLVKGLSASAQYKLDNYQYFESGKSEVPVSYAQRWYRDADGEDAVEYFQLRKRTIEDNQRRLNENYFKNSGWNASLKYDREFGKHDFSANLSHFYYSKDHDNWIQDLRFSNSILRLKHGFNDKFYTELTLAYMGSDKMPEKNRYQLFPAVGAAWVMAENTRLFDFLKLKGSFGIMGYDRATDYYLWENRWNTLGGVQFNERNNTGRSRTRIQLIGNPDLEWEKSREINVGLEGLVWDKHLQFEINYFNEFRYDMIQSPAYRYSVLAGGLYPMENQGETLNRGIEGGFNFSDIIGDFQYSIGGNFIYSENKVLKMNEVEYPGYLDYTRQTGESSDAMFGYVSNGLFTDQSQLDNHPTQTLGAYKLGNISYQDLNNDGVVDELDRRVIGNSFPRTSLGLNLDLNYKRFGLFVLGTAELGVDNWLNNSYYWNSGEDKYSTVVNDRWHPTNNPDGTYPALTTTEGSNDFRNSTFWLQDASFLRLKNVELSYTLPISSFAKNFRFHVRGTNLLVLSENKDLDPEGLNAGISNYPIFRTVTGGVTMNF